MPGADVIIPGTFSPGHSPGTAFYDSLTFLDTSHLIMEIAGRNPGEFDHITVAGHLTFDGILEVVLLDGFTPEGGDSFDLFDWGSVGGTFDHVLMPALTLGLGWDLSQLYVTGAITVLPPLDSQFFAASGHSLVAAVPAPATLLVIGAGVLVIRRVRCVLRCRGGR